MAAHKAGAVHAKARVKSYIIFDLNNDSSMVDLPFDNQLLQFVMKKDSLPKFVDIT